MSDVGSLSPRCGRDAASIQTDLANHLKYGLARDRYTATTHDRYLSLAMTIRDRLVERWIETQQTHYHRSAKRVYYLSLEFLMGRAMGNNVINLGLEGPVRQAVEGLGYDWEELRDEEVDAGLGNGGLGRLAACFLDSMATLDIPSVGYGLRYDYGIFRQEIRNGFQDEEPDDWLRGGNPWEIPRPDYRIPVHFGGRVEPCCRDGRDAFRWVGTQPVIGIPYDMPIVGYLRGTVNTLRLWSARGAEEFDFDDFNQGDYVAAVQNKVTAENLTKVLYPNDNIYAGMQLRLKQQYFFVACSIHDILRRFRKSGLPWTTLPEHAAIQLNDTHPALAIPELMRVLLDHEGLDWGEAWEITVRTFGYTNHTLLPEALETWPVHLLERLLPRHLQLIYAINHDFLETVRRRWPGDNQRVAGLSLIQEGGEKRVRMANLSIVGSHSTNGVAALHTKLLRERVVPDFAEMFPERFNSKTNGVTQRRWLLKCNPRLAALISEQIGEKWIRDLSQLKRLAPLADDATFRTRFRQVKQQNKGELAHLLRESFGFEVDPDSIFDVQVKRLHEYKRQLMNVLHIIMLYNRLRQNPALDLYPRTFIFGAKAAPGYHLAKLIIKLINNVGAVINTDPISRDRLRVYFVPNYRVSLAEKIIPAADVSEQISTAGKEASGTGNMKFMMNGALTLGTLDGANIEIVEEAGEENVFIFGLTAEEVEARRGHYNPWDCFHEHAETRQALELISQNHFSPDEPGIFHDIVRSLLDGGDPYFVLQDLPAYAEAQDRLERVYRDEEEWARKAILNVAFSGKFSSDRTILEYANEIWDARPCPIDMEHKRSHTIMQARSLLEDETTQ